MANDNYNYLTDRTGKRYVDLWLPRFILGVFDITSFPPSRVNKIFQISGLTQPDLQILSWIVNNGDIAVFNSAGVLVEVLGGSQDAVPVSAFDGNIVYSNWTPVIAAGTAYLFNAKIIYKL